MKSSKLLITLFASVSLGTSAKADQLKLDSFTSSAQLVAALPESAWRQLSPENTIVMTLPEGEVVIELASKFAPNHVENIRTLVSEKYFDGTSVIRSQDNM